MPNYLLINKDDNAKLQRLCIHFPGTEDETLGYVFEHKIGGEGAGFDIHRMADINRPEPLIICQQSAAIEDAGIEGKIAESDEELEINPDAIDLTSNDMAFSD